MPHCGGKILAYQPLTCDLEEETDPVHLLTHSSEINWGEIKHNAESTSHTPLTLKISEVARVPASIWIPFLF